MTAKTKTSDSTKSETRTTDVGNTDSSARSLGGDVQSTKTPSSAEAATQPPTTLSKDGSSPSPSIDSPALKDQQAQANDAPTKDGAGLRHDAGTDDGVGGEVKSAPLLRCRVIDPVAFDGKYYAVDDVVKVTQEIFEQASACFEPLDTADQ